MYLIVGSYWRWNNFLIRRPALIAFCLMGLWMWICRRNELWSEILCDLLSVSCLFQMSNTKSYRSEPPFLAWGKACRYLRSFQYFAIFLIFPYVFDSRYSTTIPVHQDEITKKNCFTVITLQIFQPLHRGIEVLVHIIYWVVSPY